MELPTPSADFPVTTSTLVGAATGAPHLPYSKSTSSLPSDSNLDKSESTQPNSSEIRSACSFDQESAPRLVLDESTDEDDSMDRNLPAFDAIPSNPNAPQRYASAFEAYCLERDACTAATRFDRSKVLDLCVDASPLHACVRNDMLKVITPPIRYVLYYLPFEDSF